MRIFLRTNFLALAILSAAGGFALAASITVDFESAHFVAQESGSAVLKIKLADEAGKGIPGKKIYIKSSGGTLSPVEDLGNGLYRSTLKAPEQAPPRLPGYVVLVVSADLKGEIPAAGAAIPVLSNLVIKGYTQPGTALFARADGRRLGKEITAGADGSYTLVVPLPVNAKNVEIVAKGRDTGKPGAINLKERNRTWIVMQAVPDELLVGKNGTGGAVNVYGIMESGRPIDGSKLQLNCEPGGCAVLRELATGLRQSTYTPPAAYTSGQAVITVAYGGQSFGVEFKLLEPELSRIEIASSITRAAPGEELVFDIKTTDSTGGAFDNADIDVFINGVNAGKAIPAPNGEYRFAYEVRAEDAGEELSVHAESGLRGGAGGILESNALAVSVEGVIVASLDDEEEEEGETTGTTGEEPKEEEQPPAEVSDAAPVTLTLSVSPESGLPGDAVSLTASLLDENSLRVAGHDVSFQSEAGAIGAVSKDAGGNHKATLVLDDGAAAGKVKVEATCDCDGKNLSADADVEVLPLAVATIELSADQTEIYVTESPEAAIEATVKNRRGEGVEGETIILTLKDGQTTKKATLESDSQGKAETSFQLAPAEGDVEVAASVQSNSSITGALALKKILYDVSSIEMSVTSSSIPADGASTVELEVHAINEAQSDAFGERINFTLKAGGGRLRTEFVTTGGDGRASQYYTPGTACGTAEIEAWSKRDTAVKKTILIEQTPAIPASIDIAGQPPAMTADGVGAWDMTVVVMDAGGCPVSGENLTFEVSSGPGTIEYAKATDGDGKAVAKFTAGLTPGIATILVRSETSPLIMLAVDINVSAWDAASFGVSPSSASVTSGQPFSVTLTAKDAAGRTVTTYDPAGKSFEFSGPSVAPDGTAPDYPSSASVAAAFSNGVAAVEIALYRAETTTLTVTDGDASGVSGGIVVSVSSQPSAAINSPPAGSWRNANFTVGVTNFDSGGAALSSCEYRVLSNGAESVGWTDYACDSDPQITVGSAANCRNEGADKCDVQLRSTDTAGNASPAASRTFSIDFSLPSVTINSPAASSWRNADFTVDVTNADGGGAGLATCEYRVESNGAQTVGWTSYTCSTDPVITVGAIANCKDEGANECVAQFRNTDTAGNTSTTASRTFSIDYTAPTGTFVSPAAGAWQRANFTLNVTNADTGGSGLSACSYRVLSNGAQTLGFTAYTCATDPAITVGSAANCRDQGANKCETQLSDTDAAGNTSVTSSRMFSIDFTIPAVVINSPAAGSTQSSAFTLDVTNDDTGGSGLSACSVRVLSNGAETLAWTDYSCGSDPQITVGTGQNCRDAGTNKCEAQARNTDVAGNTPATVTRTFTIDLGPPSCFISGITEDGAPECQFVSGAAVYYNNNASCSGSGQFTASVSGSGGAGTITKVTFPATVSTGGDDFFSPYSFQYTYDPAAVFSGAAAVTIYNNAAQSNTCPLNVTRDIAAPAGGSIGYADGWYTSASVAISLTNGADGLSGIDTRIIQRQSVALSAGNCGAFGTWSNIATNPPSSTYNDTTVLSGNCYKFRYVETDKVGNQTMYTSVNTAKVDANPPGAAINSPDASSWQKTDFTVDVTNSDAGGAGLSTCEYHVLSNGTERVAWTPYTCSTDPSITVGGGNSNCKDEGADKCEVQFRATDTAGTVSAVASRLFSIDFTAPSVTINSPSSNDYQGGAGFVVDTTESDGAGSGLATCEYRVESSGAETLPWTTYPCGADRTLTAGPAANCREEGVNKCRVEYRATDLVGISSAVAFRQFRIDYTNPAVVINAPAAGAWQTGDFTVDNDSSDSGGAGLAACEYKVLSSGGVTLSWTTYNCNNPNKPKVTVGSSKDCRHSGLNICEVQLKATDGAANTSAIASRTFSIDPIVFGGGGP